MSASADPATSARPDRTASLAGAGNRPKLPVPPSDAEKDLYADRNLALIVRASLASFGALLISQARFVTQSPPLLALTPLIAFTLAYYVISLFVNFGTKGFDMDAHHRRVRDWRPRSYPTLDVFLPVCGEPIEVLRNTWVHVFRLLRAYPGLATAYVLDDGDSREAQQMAETLGFTYHVRPDRGWMKKAGNLRYGFSQSFGEFILILDADFAPRADLPAEILPYFSTDPALGIVQSPQYFHTRGRMSWIERGAGAVQELFYRLVQVSRDRHDGAICVGSCAIYRRDGAGRQRRHHAHRALRGRAHRLRPAPGRVGTALHTRPAGHRPLPARPRFVPDPAVPLVRGIDVAARLPEILDHANARCGPGFCYLSGFCYYVHTALFTFATPIVPLIMLIFLPNGVRLVNYVFILPSIIYNTAVFPAWHHCRFGPAALMAKLLYGWAHVFALWDIMRGKRAGLAADRRLKTKVEDPPYLGRDRAVERHHERRLGAVGALAHRT